MNGPLPKLASFLAVMTDGAHVTRTFGAADWEHFRRQASAALIEQVNATGAGVIAFHFAYGADHSSYTSNEVDEVIFDELPPEEPPITSEQRHHFLRYRQALAERG